MSAWWLMGEGFRITPGNPNDRLHEVRRRHAGVLSHAIAAVRERLAG